MDDLLFTISLACFSLLGLSLGSFYTALASRIFYYFYGKGRKQFSVSSKTEKRISGKRNQVQLWQAILWKPSFCHFCLQPIRFTDLIPILSYVWNRGKCRYCRKPIGRWTLLGEAYLGVLLSLYAWYETSWLAAISAALFCGHLYISLVTDYRLFILDPENALFLFLLAIAYLIVRYGLDLNQMQGHLLGFFGSLLCFSLLFVLSRFGGLGFGDVILASALGLFMGLPWALIVFEVGATMSIVYILIIRKDKKSAAPLGAAMALGVFMTLPFQIMCEVKQV